MGSVVAVLSSRGKNPKKAIIVGALLGTLPDLDVLQVYVNDLEATIGHRTWTHSWVIQAIASPLIAVYLVWLDRRWSGKKLLGRTWSSQSWSPWTWLVLVFLVLTTHSGLDALTIYGTWLFWPFGNQPVMGGSVFIIDPLFTLPLLISCLILWRRPSQEKRWRIGTVGLLISSLYLGWGLYAQGYVEGLAQRSMAAQGLSWQKLVATPTPFNSVLWRIVALDGDRFHEGFHSFVDSDTSISWESFPRNQGLLSTLGERADIERFGQFNHGYFALAAVDGNVVGSDLRMGIHPHYFFRFMFATPESGGLVASKPQLTEISGSDGGFFNWLGKRLFSKDIDSLSKFQDSRGNTPIQ